MLKPVNTSVMPVTMPSEIALNHFLDLMTMFSDRNRQQIIRLFIKKSEMNVTEIAKSFPHMSRPNISHHLSLMRRARVLNARKSGKSVYYSFNQDYCVKRLQEMVKLFQQCQCC